MTDDVHPCTQAISCFECHGPLEYRYVERGNPWDTYTFTCSKCNLEHRIRVNKLVRRVQICLDDAEFLEGSSFLIGGKEYFAGRG